MGRYSPELHVLPFQPVAGQGEERPELAGQPREEEGAADVGEEAYAGLRHREDRLLGGDSELAVDREADAAAHRDAVDQGDVRDAEGADLKGDN